MKLRIRGNSIRLRLGKSEIEMLGRIGHVEDGIVFGSVPVETLRYRLQLSDRNEVYAEFHDGCIAVNIPQQTATQWIEEDDVTITGLQPVDDGDDLAIVIEKDFECLTRKNKEDESDSFPRPKDMAAC